MPLSFNSADDYKWSVKKIAVVGPGIVGMPMAALLADARIREGSDTPAKVVVLQRNSPNSGWKVDCINSGKSVIGGVEPALDRIVGETVKEGILSASHDYNAASDADMILVCIQTDKKGFAPDYGPMFEGLEGLALALKKKPAGNIPIVVFESTLAPSSMATVMKDHFAKHGLIEGKDILLGNSPNRVMPGRLVERVAAADKLAAGLHPLTPKLIHKIYQRIVTKGTVHVTNSMTAEVVKTLENAYRDVRIAFAAEIVRYCDEHDIDFYAVRDAVNTRLAQSDDASGDATAVPSGGVLVPTVGVGGHCLPKDGILLWWRKIESGADTSKALILESRKVNDASPEETTKLAERLIGKIDGKRVTLLGTAYRFDSEDTRNSPTMTLAQQLVDRGCKVVIHDPYVKDDDQNLTRLNLTQYFTNDLAKAVGDAEVLFFCTGHGVYKNGLQDILRQAPKATAVIDGANLYHHKDFAGSKLGYTGIGRGRKAAPAGFVEFVEASFRAMERGTANELQGIIDFLNARYAQSDFNKVSLDTVRMLGGTCVTGCDIAQTGKVASAPSYNGFTTHLAACAAATSP